MNNETLVPIAALNQYDYCPRRCYYMHFEHQFEENAHTVEGTIRHRRADSGGQEQRGDLWRARSVWLVSHRLGLVGKADLVEEKDGKLYPVEYKKGERGKWLNDHLQVAAQAMCLEEMLGEADRIDHAYLFYAATGRRQTVAVDDALRQAVQETAAAVRHLVETGERPAAVYGPRCRGCSLYRVCLPRETEVLRRAHAVRD